MHAFTNHESRITPASPPNSDTPSCRRAAVIALWHQATETGQLTIPRRPYLGRQSTPWSARATTRGTSRSPLLLGPLPPFLALMSVNAGPATDSSPVPRFLCQRRLHRDLHRPHPRICAIQRRPRPTRLRSPAGMRERGSSDWGSLHLHVPIAGTVAAQHTYGDVADEGVRRGVRRDSWFVKPFDACPRSAVVQGGTGRVPLTWVVKPSEVKESEVYGRTRSGTPARVTRHTFPLLSWTVDVCATSYERAGPPPPCAMGPEDSDVRKGVLSAADGKVLVPPSPCLTACSVHGRPTPNGGGRVDSSSSNATLRSSGQVAAGYTLGGHCRRHSKARYSCTAPPAGIGGPNAISCGVRERVAGVAFPAATPSCRCEDGRAY